jgi:N,N'-diacetyllegionaminate synthase
MTKKTLVIAEAGVNHNGDMSMAKRLIEVAADAGADFVKFQTFNADRLVSVSAQKAQYQTNGSSSSETQHAMLQKLELTPEMHFQLIAHCNANKIGFFSTGFDEQSVDLLMQMGQTRIKVPSGEITNLPYLRHVARHGVPVILSTGMAILGEIEAAIAALEQTGLPREMITVLHCTTEYPTPMAEVNLNAMLTIGAAFGLPVGYSDHTQGIEVAIAAVALGARVIEKHFTLDRALPGPDHRASLEPAELKAMVSAIRNIEVALGDSVKRLTPSEAKNKSVARKSLLANRPIEAGEVFSAENVVAKRPGNGLSPMRWDEVIGRVATRAYKANDFIEI